MTRKTTNSIAVVSLAILFAIFLYKLQATGGQDNLLGINAGSLPMLLAYYVVLVRPGWIAWLALPTGCVVCLIPCFIYALSISASLPDALFHFKMLSLYLILPALVFSLLLGLLDFCIRLVTKLVVGDNR